MAKPKKTSVFKAEVPKAETSMDKTTRIVKKIVDEEVEQRQSKNARLRKARLEREANTPTEVVGAAQKAKSPKTTAKQ